MIPSQQLSYPQVCTIFSLLSHFSILCSLSLSLVPCGCLSHVPCSYAPVVSWLCSDGFVGFICVLFCLDGLIWWVLSMEGSDSVRRQGSRFQLWGLSFQIWVFRFDTTNLRVRSQQPKEINLREPYMIMLLKKKFDCDINATNHLVIYSKLAIRGADIR